MTRARPFVSWSLLPLLLIAGCSGKKSDAPVGGGKAALGQQDVDPAPDANKSAQAKSAVSHIAMLVPADTVVYVQLQSLARFDDLLAKLARANATLGRSFDEIGRSLHRNMPGDERAMETDEPIGIAISLPADREPAITFVLPMKDVVAYKRSMQLGPHRPQPVFDGSYLAISEAPQYEPPREPVALAQGETDRAIVVRADLAKLDRRFGSQLRLALAALESGADDSRIDALGADPRLAGVLQLVADPLLYALAVGQSLELSCELQAGRIAVHCSLQTRDAGVLSAWTSTPSVDLAPFARSMVASDTFAIVGGCNPAVLADRLAGILTETEAQREHAGKLLERFSTLFGSIGAVSASLVPGESHIALHVAAEDDPAFAENLASTFELFSRSGLGLVVQSKNVSTIEDIEVQDMLVHFDALSMRLLTGEKTEDVPAIQQRLDAVARSLFGAENVRVRIASFGSRGLIAIGNDEPWFRRTLLWSRADKDLTPPDVHAALEHLGSAPAAAIVRFDMARWSQDHEGWDREWRALSEPVRDLETMGSTAVHAIDPEPLTLHVGAEGGTLRFGFSIGLAIEHSAQMAAR